MIILGSTGSIGQNALEIADKHNIKIEALSGGKNTSLLSIQIAKFSPKFVYIKDKQAAKELSKTFSKTKFFWGENGLEDLISSSKSKKLLNAIVGFAGLGSTVTAQKCDKKVALANKESLVVAGKFIDTKKIFPVDSEHFALWYLLGKKKPKKMIITASGGALRNTPLENLENVGIDEVLAHPNWSMGRKITVDSATMANKLLELMEARWLFGENIEYDAVIEPSSSVHAFLEYADGVTSAKLSRPDMKLPIGYALLGKYDGELEPFDLTKLSKLEFREIDIIRYPLWALKRKLVSEPDMGVVFNASNEIAVESFLEGKIKYSKIAEVVFRSIEQFNGFSTTKLSDLYKIDKEVRAYAKTVS